MPRDWLGWTSPKWPILCWVGCNTLTQSINQCCYCQLLMWWCVSVAELEKPVTVIRSNYQVQCRYLCSSSNPAVLNSKKSKYGYSFGVIGEKSIVKRDSLPRRKSCVFVYVTSVTIFVRRHPFTVVFDYRWLITTALSSDIMLLLKIVYCMLDCVRKHLFNEPG